MLKKFWVLNVFCLLFLLGVSNVNANVLNIDDVINRFNEANIKFKTTCSSIGMLQAISPCEFNIRLEKDSENNGIINISGGMPSFPTDHSNNSTSGGFMVSGDSELGVVHSLQYNANSIISPVLEEGEGNEVILNTDLLGIVTDELLDVILNLSGYEKMALDTIENFETYGLEIKGDGYVYPAVVQNSPRSSGVIDLSSIFVKSFKVSLDTAKINALVTAYGDPYIRTLITIKPTLEVRGVTQNQVTLLPKIDYELPEDYEYSFYIYECSDAH